MRKCQLPGRSKNFTVPSQRNTQLSVIQLVCVTLPFALYIQLHVDETDPRRNED